MLTVGDEFPDFDLTAGVSLESGNECGQINQNTNGGREKTLDPVVLLPS